MTGARGCIRGPGCGFFLFFSFFSRLGGFEGSPLGFCPPTPSLNLTFTRVSSFFDGLIFLDGNRLETRSGSICSSSGLFKQHFVGQEFLFGELQSGHIWNPALVALMNKPPSKLLGVVSSPTL